MKIYKKKFLAPKTIGAPQHTFETYFLNSLTLFLTFDKQITNLNSELTKIMQLIRERRFIHFWHFREDLSDHSQTLPEQRRRQPKQKSGNKIGNIYGHLAKIAISNLKYCRNFKIYEKFERAADT